MAFQKKEWHKRIVQFPGRRKLTSSGINNVYNVERAEGEVLQEGDGFTKENMNDLEERIEKGIESVENIEETLSTFPESGSSKILYIDIETNIIYRWDTATSSYIAVGRGTDNIVFMPYSKFPLSGENDVLYVDIEETTELKLYRWNGSEYIDAKSGNGDLSVISDEYDPKRSYVTGDYTIKENVLYRFISNKPAGEWDETTVEATTVMMELSGLNANMEWKLLGRKTSSSAGTIIQIPIPVDLEFAELCVTLESSNAGNYVFSLPKQALTPTKGIRQGFYSSANLTGFCSITVSTSTIQSGSYNQLGVVAKDVVMTAYYR